MNSSTPLEPTPLDIEQAVKERYSAASEQQEAALCCPVDYETEYLKVLPQELIDRDYGCGDPSRYVEAGETVLDLGSGGGKICYIASQIVGKSGQVIGVDMNDDMLDLAHQFKSEISEKIGYDNVRFCKGRIQDLATDLNAVEQMRLRGRRRVDGVGADDASTASMVSRRQRRADSVAPKSCPMSAFVFAGPSTCQASVP